MTVMANESTPNVVEAVKILFLIKDKIEFVIEQTSLNEPLIEISALISSAIKALVD